ncbi:MAG: TolB protein [Gaiellaceae bacterium]|nr:TolB protein [Gaiellaceae bacterium]
MGFQSELFSVLPDGTGLRRLTRNRVEDSDPKWSPEGRRLLSDSITGIVIRDARGKVLRRLPRTFGTEPRWSRDGRRIAYLEFQCDDPDERGGPVCADLWIVRSDGTARRRLVKANVDVTQDTDGRYAWAPKGRRLVYAAFDPTALLIVNVADGAKRTLRGTRRVGARQPSWSPDGRLIAFLRQRAPYGGSDIYVVAPDGTGLRRLVRTRGVLETPRWSPDGHSIAYFRLINDSPGQEQWAVVVADADGGRPRRLGVTHTWDWLDWSPDSKGVLWVDFFDIYDARADGRGRPRLVARDGETPDWG